MTTPAGSPRGTIHLWEAGACHPGPAQKEVAEKQDDRGSIQQQLEGIHEGREELERNPKEKKRKKVAQGTHPPKVYSEGSAWSKNLHPYVDTTPRDNNYYLWTIYPENLAGQYKIILQGSTFPGKPTWKFWGTAYDFAHTVKNEIPNVTHLIISDCKKIAPESIVEILANELPKIGVKLIESRELQQKFDFDNKDVVNKKHNPGGFGVIELADADKDPSTDSQMRDPAHKHFDVFLGSTRKRLNRILKIALHVIRTPQDELEGPDTEWSVVPNEPSSAEEQEALAKFPTRDDAVAWMKEQEGEKLPDYLKEEESLTAGGSIQASFMHDWLDPEEAADAAWLMRKPDSKIEVEIENEE